jgi:transketolase
LDNLIGVIDVNRLGQRGETMYGHDLNAYETRIFTFGWETFRIDGHSFEEVLNAYENAVQVSGKPVIIIARTLKRQGVSFLEDQDGWHGKVIDKDRLDEALKELGRVDKSV